MFQECKGATWQGQAPLSRTLITSKTSIKSVSRAASRADVDERADSAPSWHDSGLALRSPETTDGPSAARSCRGDWPDQSVDAGRDGCKPPQDGPATRWPDTAAATSG